MFRQISSSRTRTRSPLVVLMLVGLLITSASAGPAPAAAQADSPFILRWSDAEVDASASVAWGDYDGDGDLDLAVGNGYHSQTSCMQRAPSRLYRNDGASPAGELRMRLAWSAPGPDDTLKVAWGDVNGDGRLDLAVANCTLPNQIYINTPVPGATEPAWTVIDLPDPPAAAPGAYSTSLAWGDYDRDGRLDLALGSVGAANVIYHHAGLDADDRPVMTPITWDVPAESTMSVAWGDLNADGWLDLAVGNGRHQSHVYLNDGGSITTTHIWSSPPGLQTSGIALGDIDGKHGLDLVVGNYMQLSQIYLNTGSGLPAGADWAAPAPQDTTSLDLGDYDGDGDLDIVLGNAGAQGQLSTLYRNDSAAGGLSLTSTLFSSNKDFTQSVAWGDVDGDGDLDLATGNGGEVGNANRIYRNERGTLGVPVLTQPFSGAPSGLAWGDVDNDGDLDLVVANHSTASFGLSMRSQLYLNQQGTLQLDTSDTRWQPPANEQTYSVAWGDVNGDGFLDLAVGNGSLFVPLDPSPSAGAPNRIYLNQGGRLGSTPAWTSEETDDTHSVAWGDMDGDGDLDLAVGNGHRTEGEPNRIYRNDTAREASTLALTLVWTAPEVETTMSVAWGDVDGDGDLDLAAGNGADTVGANRLYRNDGVDAQGAPILTSAWTSAEADRTFSVAWGDVDGDGDLDLAAGNYGAPNRIYLNQGGALSAAAGWSSIEADQTASVAWGDVDGDGDLDLVAGNSLQPIRLYLNGGQGLATTASWASAEENPVMGLAWGDLDGDGDLDLAAAVDDLVNPWPTQPLTLAMRIYTNSLYHPPASPRPINQLPTVKITRPDPTGAAGFFATGRISAGGPITIAYTLADPEGDPVRFIRATYSLDGGGSWHTAVPTDSVTTDLAAAPAGTAHTFVWDSFASGFFGQSDAVVFRIEAYPDLRAQAGGLPGPYQRPSASATTSPFRVRGTQVRVVDPDGAPVQGALVLRRGAGQTERAALLKSDAGTLYTTDAQGYLGGRGSLAPGDTLIALAPVPISATAPYSPSVTLYQTNIITSTTGVSGWAVQRAGVQTITVSPARPLLLFHPTIALEWDARYDARYMAQLAYDLGRASELLFNATNGQAALGDINLFYDKENWDYADIRIYASNRLRPSAIIGGVASQEFTRTLSFGGASHDLFFAPGQLKMGAVWNRFGNAGTNLSEDWPRTLAHELGHYLLFLDDNYLGLSPAGQLIPVESCPGLMADPYASVELRPAAGWDGSCAGTLSQQTSGRADWATVADFYPQLHAPSAPFGAPALDGPTSMPLGITAIISNAPLTPTARLDVPIFYVKSGAGERVLPSARATAYLFQDSWLDAGYAGYDRLTLLGRATQDQVLARGARVGDRVCIFDPASAAIGCETISPGDETLTLTPRADWRPAITVTPVTSTTLALTVTLDSSAGAPLRAALFPLDNLPGTAPISLAEATPGVYGGSFSLDEPLPGAYIHLWAEEAGPRREMVSSFSLGGNPGAIRSGGGAIRSGGGAIRSGGGAIRSGGGAIRSGGGAIRSGGGAIRSGGAPVSSAEGDVLLFGNNLTFTVGQFLALQSTSTLPPPPPWATVIGQGYRLTTSASAPSLTATVLSFGYQGSEVPAGEEAGIQVYYQAPAAGQWRALPTTLNTYHNLASAANQGPGLYVLMSSISVPLRQPGWNMFAYPVAGSRPVGEALAGIAGAYRAVYGYEPGDTADPWKLYAPAPVPAWANDLEQLEFGRGYWINATQAITIPLKGASGASLAASLPTPPATYYGTLPAWAGRAPAPGQTLTASIGGQVCGQTATRREGGQVVYVVDVLADGGGASAGCGVAGRTITFQLSNGAPAWAAPWDNGAVHMLTPGRQLIYLPLLRHTSEHKLRSSRLVPPRHGSAAPPPRSAGARRA